MARTAGIERAVALLADPADRRAPAPRGWLDLIGARDAPSSTGLAVGIDASPTMLDRAMRDTRATALEDRGLVDVHQRVAGLTQLVGARTADRGP